MEEAFQRVFTHFYAHPKGGQTVINKSTHHQQHSIQFWSRLNIPHLSNCFSRNIAFLPSTYRTVFTPKGHTFIYIMRVKPAAQQIKGLPILYQQALPFWIWKTIMMWPMRLGKKMIGFYKIRVLFTLHRWRSHNSWWNASNNSLPSLRRAYVL